MSRLVLDEHIDYLEFMAKCNKENRWFVEAVNETVKFMRDMESKLAHYEDLEEQGLLLELPCKVGDTVWLVCHKPTKCSKHQEYRDEYNCQGCEEWYCDSRIEYYIHPIDSVKPDWIVKMEDCIGDTVFLTKEEAEAKLKELKGETNETE